MIDVIWVGLESSASPAEPFQDSAARSLSEFSITLLVCQEFYGELVVLIYLYFFLFSILSAFFYSSILRISLAVIYMTAAMA